VRGSWKEEERGFGFIAIFQKEKKQE